MLFEFPELRCYLRISGFDASASDVAAILQAVQDKFPRVAIQLVDIDRVPGSRFLLHAVFNAWKSFHSGDPISRTLGMEILLFVAANSQISEAIKAVGVTSNTRKIAAVLAGPSREEVSAAADFLSNLLRGQGRDELLEEWSPERIQNVRFAYQIGGREFKATARKGEEIVKVIERLAIERSALLAIRK